MAITKDRVHGIAGTLLIIRTQLASLKTEELTEIINGLSQDEAIGPLIDPGKWAGTGMFDSTRKTIEVLRMIIELKEELERR